MSDQEKEFFLCDDLTVLVVDHSGGYDLAACDWVEPWMQREIRELLLRVRRLEKERREGGRMTFGELVRHAREARSLSQAELQRRIGRGGGFLSRVEDGSIGVPERDVVEAIARELGIDPAELWQIAAFERDPDVFKAGFRAGRLSPPAE